MAQNRGRCRARQAQGCLRASGRLWPRAQTIPAALSGDYLGQNQAGPIQFAPGHIASAAEARGRWLGNVSDYSGGVRAWLSLRMRVLYGDGIFWRLHPLSHESKRGERTIATEIARAGGGRPD